MLTDLREALRYLGCPADDEEMLSKAREAAASLEDALQPKRLWRCFPLSRRGGQFLLEGPGLSLPGELAARTLRDCDRAAVLVCTLGARYESLQRALLARDPAKALVTDACASALTEAGCALAEEEIRQYAPDAYLTDRFSPGYGDLPLDLQQSLLEAVDARRRLGVTVTDSFMLLPQKTVTAIIGLARTPQPAVIRGCAHCPLAGHCAFRREGSACAL